MALNIVNLLKMREKRSRLKKIFDFVITENRRHRQNDFSPIFPKHPVVFL